MRTPSMHTHRGGFVPAATLSGVLVGGALLVGTIATSATLVVTDPAAPNASADSLSRFDSCPALRDWFVEHGVAEVGPYGWNQPRVYLAEDAVGGTVVHGGSPMPLDGRAPDSAAGSATGSATSSDARANSSTGTNTQEAEVDEPDLAKTDGHRVVRLVDQRVVVISDVTGAEPRELGRISLPVDSSGGELLLAGDHVLVSQAGRTWGGPTPAVPETAGGTPLPPVSGTRIVDVDISDPAHPRIVHDDTYTGSLVSMRLYGDTVRLVTSTPRPELGWVTPGPSGTPGTPGTPGTTGLSPDEATRRNRELVRSTTLADWLPAVVDNISRSRRPLLDCADVYHPAVWSGGDVTTVTTYTVDDLDHATSVAVTADGQVVYSSANRLYVASARVDTPSPWGRMRGWMSGETSTPIRPQEVRTLLHAFALDGTSTRYVGSGHVSGSVRDRWSLDEHDGRLRVAWTRTDSGGRTQNGLTVMAESDGALVPVGTIERLGLDENIQAVRWFDDFAVLVTFRQMDPLYTIDLTDPTRPREVGQLKIPGYSGYLHPIGNDLLLGLGVEATDAGRAVGAQAGVFDVHDLAAPRRLSHQSLGDASLPALFDPRGFTWLPAQRTGITSVQSWSAGRCRLVALHVDDGGAIEVHDLGTDVGWNARTLPLADGRVAVVDQDLRVLDVG